MKRRKEANNVCRIKNLLLLIIVLFVLVFCIETNWKLGQYITSGTLKLRSEVVSPRRSDHPGFRWIEDDSNDAKDVRHVGDAHALLSHMRDQTFDSTFVDACRDFDFDRGEEKKDSSGQRVQRRTDRIALWVRVALKATLTRFLLENLLPSTAIFWPQSEGELILVFDEAEHTKENLPIIRDIQRLPPHSAVAFEALPKAFWNRNGYSVQIWSTFYMDLYTDAPYVSIVDTDAAFITVPVREELVDVQGRPKVIGYIGRVGNTEFWNKNSPRSTKKMIGRIEIANFMSNWPMVIKRSHLPLLREHVRTHMGTSTFTEAFEKGCIHESTGTLCSQQNVIFNYLLYFHREEYVWSFQEESEMDRRWFKTNAVLRTPHYLPILPSNNTPYIRLAIHIKYCQICPSFAILMRRGYCRALKASALVTATTDMVGICDKWKDKSPPVELYFDNRGPSFSFVPWTVSCDPDCRVVKDVSIGPPTAPGMRGEDAIARHLGHLETTKFSFSPFAKFLVRRYAHTSRV